jgi:hypothetical protein
MEAGRDLSRLFMNDPPTALVGFAGLFTQSLGWWDFPDTGVFGSQLLAHYSAAP